MTITMMFYNKHIKCNLFLVIINYFLKKSFLFSSHNTKLVKLSSDSKLSDSQNFLNIFFVEFWQQKCIKLSEEFSLAISPGANLQLIKVIDIPLKKHAEAAMLSHLSVSQEVHNFSWILCRCRMFWIIKEKRKKFFLIMPTNSTRFFVIYDQFKNELWNCLCSFYSLQVFRVYCAKYEAWLTFLLWLLRKFLEKYFKGLFFFQNITSQLIN